MTSNLVHKVSYFNQLLIQSKGLFSSLITDGTISRETIILLCSICCRHLKIIINYYYNYRNISKLQGAALGHIVRLSVVANPVPCLTHTPPTNPHS